MKYKAIIFDFFGVLSSEVAPFWFQNHFTQEEVRGLKEKYVHPADIGSITEKELLVKLSEISSQSPEEIKEEWNSLAVLNKEVLGLALDLKKKYKIGLCTNAVSGFIRNILDTRSLENVFDKIVVSSEAGVAKPERRIYELLLEKLEVDASEVIFIDDNSINIQGAEALGIKSFLFTGVEKLKDNLKSEGI